MDVLSHPDVLSRLWNKLLTSYTMEAAEHGQHCKMKKEDALKIIVQCAKVFDSNLVDSNYLFVYQIIPRAIECLDTLFQSRNFMHLTGIKDTSGRGSVWFFNACVSSKNIVQEIVHTR